MKHLFRAIQRLPYSLRLAGISLLIAAVLLGGYTTTLFYAFSEKMQTSCRAQTRQIVTKVEAQLKESYQKLAYMQLRFESLSSLQDMDKPLQVMGLQWYPSKSPYRPEKFFALHTTQGLMLGCWVSRTTRGLEGKLQIHVPLILNASPWHLTFDIEENTSFAKEDISFIPIPGTQMALKMKIEPRVTFSFFLREHRIALFIFSLFASIAACLIILSGRRSYQRVYTTLREEIAEVTQASHHTRREADRLLLQYKQLVQTNTQKEAFINHILERYRLTREKIYLIMNSLIFSEGRTSPAQKEAQCLLIKDMQNHFGLPEIKNFSLEETIHQVCAVFQQVIQENHLRILFESCLRADRIENDPLIFSVVLANLLYQRLVRLPPEDRLTLRLQRYRKDVILQILDKGFELSETSLFLLSDPRQFFFVKEDVLEDLCASIGVRVMHKPRDAEDPFSFNKVTLMIPLKLKPVDLSSFEKHSAKIIPFPGIRRPSHDSKS